MKSKISPSFPTSASEFNFPSWPDSPSDNHPFVLPNLPAADARQQVSTDTTASDSNPFFAPAPQLEKLTEETAPLQSPFGIPLSSLAPAPESQPGPVRRLLSFIGKTSLICLFAAIGWIGYAEFVDASGKDTFANKEASPSPQLLPEEITVNSQSPQSFGAPEEAEKTLRERLAKEPLNAELILSLADNLSGQGKKNEAWLLLAKSTRTGDKRFGSRILALGLATGKHDETLMLLDPKAPGAPEWDNEDRITIARLYEKSGNTERSLKL